LSFRYSTIHLTEHTVACKKNECDTKFDVQPLYNANRDAHQEFFYICVPLTKLYSIPKIGRDFIDFEQVPVSAVVTTDSHMPRMSENHVFTSFLYRNEQCKLISSIVPLGLVQC
jgi:predicted phosphoadenosine phosphosulfate sulfurtransferase